MKNSEKIIVAFHVGRGGRFYNEGFLSFCGEKEISDFTEHLFLNYENYLDFKNRFGWDYTGDSDQKCILDLLTDDNIEELEERFGITEKMLGEQRYFDGGGNAVGLTKAEEETGVGCINIDNGFDTTYTCYLEDCNEEEINCLLMSNDYKSSRLEEALKAFETETEE